MKLNKIGFFVFLIAIAVGCSSQSNSKQPTHATPDSTDPALSNHSAGLNLPEGFKATVVADDIGAARHITIADNGDIYIGLRHKKMEVELWPSAIQIVMEKQMSSNILASIEVQALVYITATYITVLQRLYTVLK